MDIGLCAWSFTGAHRDAGRDLDPHTPEGLARLALDYGLSSIEFAPGPLQQKTPDELQAFKDFLAANNLAIVLDTGGANLAEDSAPLRQTLEMAHKVGAPVVRTTISNLLEGDRRRHGHQGWKDHLQSLVSPFREVMALAEDCAISVGIENHQDICSWEMLWLHEQVGSPLLGVTMDCGNALAVGEDPLAFARRILPMLKHVHIKDYTVHPSPSGYRFKRCAIGAGVVDWPGLFALFDEGAPQALRCIELGASTARHIRLLEDDYWSTYDPRPLEETLAALRILHRAARPAEEEWTTPHERGEDPATCATYELDQFADSVAYLRKIC